ncbi:MAG TPA: hypothetical protein VHO69_09180, partial [Phototrophicaceae bacterium]|nr:hypothetical protein [Phototrophicaceae bacterium]
ITYSQYTAGAENFMPLVFFDSQNQVFSVAIPMAVIMAVGANAEAVYREARAFLGKRLANKSTAAGAVA